MALWRQLAAAARRWLPARRLVLVLCAPIGPGGGGATPRPLVAVALERPVRASGAEAAPGRAHGPRCRCRGRVRPKRRRSAPEQPEPATDSRFRADAASKPRRSRAAPPPPPSACRLALTEEIAIAPSIPDIHGPGGCGGEDLVRLEAVVLPDKRQVALKPAAILRCTMASAIADWIRTDMAPLAASLGSVISDLDNFDSFECRGRNRVAGAKLSEHGRANALDVRGAEARQRPVDRADRPHRAARPARERAAFGVRAIFNGARAGLGRLSRGPHPSRSDGAAQQLQDLPVERVGSAAADRAAAAGRAARRGAAARGRRQRTGQAGESRYATSRRDPDAATAAGRRAPAPPTKKRRQTGAFRMLDPMAWLLHRYWSDWPPPCSAICELNGESP